MTDKILQFTSLLQHVRKDIRLGGLVGIYQLMKMKGVKEDVQNVVVEEVFTVLADFETQEPIFLVAALEVVGLIGPNERSITRMSVIK